MKYRLLLILPLLGMFVALAGDSRAGDRKVNPAAIYGRIQLVSSFPDYRVKAVGSFADVHIRLVNSLPGQGQWQIVDSFPDYKIQMVDSFEDFAVTFTGGCPKKPR